MVTHLGGQRSGVQRHVRRCHGPERQLVHVPDHRRSDDTGRRRHGDAGGEHHQHPARARSPAARPRWATRRPSPSTTAPTCRPAGSARERRSRSRARRRRPTTARSRSPRATRTIRAASAAARVERLLLHDQHDAGHARRGSREDRRQHGHRRRLASASGQLHGRLAGADDDGHRDRVEPTRSRPATRSASQATRSARTRRPTSARSA